MEYRPELDGIRAIAVLAVIAFHSGLKPATGGWLGVDIFFVLSGYLITTILVREHDRSGTVSLRDFWIRRLLRLYPALVVVLVLGGFFFSTLGDGGTFVGYLRTAAASGFYVQNLIWVFAHDEVGLFGHTWSLAVEMQFYLVWPALFIWMLRRNIRPLPWIIGGAVAAYALYVLQSGPHLYQFPDAYYLPWTRAFELLLGAMVAVVLAARPARDPAEPVNRRWIGWLIAGVFSFVLLAAWTDSIYTDQRAIIWESPAAALLTVALLLHLDRVRDTGVGGALTWRPLVWIGKVSYGAYLFHYPVVVVLHQVADLHEAKVILVLTLAITLALSAISWHFVEQPALRLKKRFTGKASATA